jgi:hypothetical protein
MTNKPAKAVNIEAQFHELKGGTAYQHGRGTGSTVKSAAARAMADLINRPGLKRKRFTRFSATVTIGSIGQ